MDEVIVLILIFTIFDVGETSCIRNIEIIRDDVIISTPGYDEGRNYDVSLHCKWNFHSDGNITVRFLYFDVEYHHQCIWDYVMIYTGECGTTAATKHCGTVAPPAHSGRRVCLEFYSDHIVTRTGFQVIIATATSFTPEITSNEIHQHNLSTKEYSTNFIADNSSAYYHSTVQHNYPGYTASPPTLGHIQTLSERMHSSATGFPFTEYISMKGRKTTTESIIMTKSELLQPSHNHAGGTVVHVQSETPESMNLSSISTFTKLLNLPSVLIISVSSFFSLEASFTLPVSSTSLLTSHHLVHSGPSSAPSIVWISEQLTQYTVSAQLTPMPFTGSTSTSPSSSRLVSTSGMSSTKQTFATSFAWSAEMSTTSSTGSTQTSSTLSTVSAQTAPTSSTGSAKIAPTSSSWSSEISPTASTGTMEMSLTFSAWSAQMSPKSSTGTSQMSPTSSTGISQMSSTSSSWSGQMSPTSSTGLVQMSPTLSTGSVQMSPTTSTGSAQMSPTSSTGSAQISPTSSTGSAQILARSSTGTAQISSTSSTVTAQISPTSSTGSAQILARSSTGTAQISSTSSTVTAQISPTSSTGSAQISARSSTVTAQISPTSPTGSAKISPTSPTGSVQMSPTSSTAAVTSSIGPVSISPTSSQLNATVGTSAHDARTDSMDYECGLRGVQMNTSEKRPSNLADVGEWPWMVGIRTDGHHVCGGSLISDLWVVTAGHCLTGYINLPHLVSVVIGTILKTGSDAEAQILRISEIVLHPSYDFIYKADIALLRLQKPVNFGKNKQPICLRNGSTSDRCFVAGWGIQDFTAGGNQDYSDDLKYVEVDILNNTDCSDIYPGRIDDTVVCASNGNGGYDTCKGDSGGPLMCEGGGNRWSLVGIMSWGEESCNGVRFPGVFTNVASYLTWIESSLHKEEAPIFTELCDFESRGLCGIDVVSHGSFTWTKRKSGWTYGGQPLQDHSNKNIKGHYFYADSYMGQGQEAVLEVNVGSNGGGEGRCLKLWYNFHGDTELLLTVKIYSSEYNKTVLTLSTSLNGWQETEVNIPGEITIIQMLALDLPHSHKTGGIAIDDVLLNTGPCTVLNDGRCDFNYGLCGYTNSSDDIGKWTTVSTSDKTNQQALVFVSSWFPLQSKAVLLSPPLNSSGEKCFVFQYKICESACKMSVMVGYIFNGVRYNGNDIWTTRQIPDSCITWLTESVHVQPMPIDYFIAVRAEQCAQKGLVFLDNFSYKTGKCTS